MIWCVASTVATAVYPCMTPLLVTIFTLSLSVRLLFRIASLAPRRSSGCRSSHVRSSAASRIRRSRRAVSWALSVGATSRPSSVRCRASIGSAARSIWAAGRSKSARVPLRCVEALLGSFTPSIANISRPMSPCRSHTASTAAKIGATWSPSVLTECAIVVKCGRESPLRAMHVTCSSQARAMARLLPRPRESANRTTRSSIPGGEAGAPVASFRYRTSKGVRSIACSRT